MDLFLQGFMSGFIKQVVFVAVLAATFYGIKETNLPQIVKEILPVATAIGISMLI